MPSDPANAPQIAYWNEQAGPRWVELQDRLDAQLGPLGEAVLDAAALGPGDRVLDVGCGCGASSRAAAARVAPGGRIVGMDVSAPMLARGRELARADGAPGLSFVEADAQVHAFEAGAFDAVVSRFGVMFFDAPEAAFANLRRALAPGGRIAFVCWQALGRNAWMAVPLAAAAKHLDGLPPPPDPHAPGPFAFADADRVGAILAGAGFADARLEPLEGAISIGGAATVEEAGRFAVEMGPLGKLLRDRGADEALRERVVRSAAEALEPYAAEGGVAAPYAAWLVTARAPA